jgi:histone arginine demethylase JMJD6
VPVNLQGCTEDWKMKNMTFEDLVERFGDLSFRFSDTHPEEMFLEDYAKYLENNNDDSPLGIYDSQFGEDPTYPIFELVNEYSVPEIFSKDLFCVCEERPPFRWILAGPARSGTGMHIDPLYTSAWVTLLQGKKRWVMFPPHTPGELVGMRKCSPLESVHWFLEYYDIVTSDSWTGPKPLEVLQLPGDTVYVPPGWLHVVLNLEQTFTVTQNFASQHGDFVRMWQDICTDEPEFAASWFSELRKQTSADIVKLVAMISKHYILNKDSYKIELDVAGNSIFEKIPNEQDCTGSKCGAIDN